MKQPSIVLAGIDVGSAELVVALQRDGQAEPIRTLANSAAHDCQLHRGVRRIQKGGGDHVRFLICSASAETRERNSSGGLWNEL